MVRAFFITFLFLVLIVETFKNFYEKAKHNKMSTEWDPYSYINVLDIFIYL